jgi:hypothetical protein
MVTGEEAGAVRKDVFGLSFCENLRILRFIVERSGG